MPSPAKTAPLHHYNSAKNQPLEAQTMSPKLSFLVVTARVMTTVRLLIRTARLYIMNTCWMEHSDNLGSHNTVIALTMRIWLCVTNAVRATATTTATRTSPELTANSDRIYHIPKNLSKHPEASNTVPWHPRHCGGNLNLEESHPKTHTHTHGTVVGARVFGM